MFHFEQSTPPCLQHYSRATIRQRSVEETRSKMKSPIIKRSIVVNGHKTSISLEDAFWTEIKAIALQKNTTIKDLVTNIDRDRQAAANLSSALRVFVLRHFQAA